MKKYLCILLYIFSFSILLINCGLPLSSVAEPPVVKGVSSSNSVGFTAPSDDSNILGYEIYYKIYKDNDGDVKNLISLEKEKFNITNSSYNYEFGKSKLDKLKFHRLNYGELKSTTKHDSPLISVIYLQAAQSLVITAGTSSDSIIINNLPSIGYPLRVAIDSDEDFKDFNNDSVVGSGADIDIDHNDVTNDSQFSVSFVAYSYVNNVLFPNSENSYPVFLGTVNDITN